MNVTFNGYGENAVTFEADSNVTVGAAVKMTDDGKVTACASGEVFCGVCLSVRDGYAVVQLSGYISMPAKTKIAAGYKKLTTGENNTVAVSTSGREYLVVNSTATSVGFIL
ncbi:hypothetical protein [Ruminococcus sp.]|uniref:hypothetical protein n=1 Tax=Ruminococcus sp. TaxID=41978 RepID=UPI0038708F14